MVVVTTGAVLELPGVWAFFFRTVSADFFTFAVYFVRRWRAASAGRKAVAAMKAVAQQTREPFLYTTLAGLCYLSFYFLFSDPFAPGIGYASDRFFSQILAGDNVIPAIFADKNLQQKP